MTQRKKSLKRYNDAIDLTDGFIALIEFKIHLLEHEGINVDNLKEAKEQVVQMRDRMLSSMPFGEIEQISRKQINALLRG